MPAKLMEYLSILIEGSDGLETRDPVVARLCASIACSATPQICHRSDKIQTQNNSDSSMQRARSVLYR